MRTIFFWLSIFCVYSLAIDSAHNSWAQTGSLLISPPRVVLDYGKKTQDIILVNIGQDTASYAISWIENRMTGTGELQQIAAADSGQLLASPHIRFFPRRVTLGPHETQLVRLQIKRGLDLPQGEYRSHLYFRSIPNDQWLEDDSTAFEKGLYINIRPIYGWSIPVIMRRGDLHAAAALSDLSIITNPGSGQKQLHLMISRTGDKSLFGAIEVIYHPRYGNEQPLLLMNGIAVYTPNRTRSVVLNLPQKEGVSYEGGYLKIKYIDLSDPDKSILDEKDLLLP